MAGKEHRFCIAPMMDGTDRHCRYFHRLLTRRARLYTEMIVAEAAIHGDRERLLDFDPVEHPVALQLGGSDPALLAEAARIGADYGYDEINLNVGCPSDRVQSGAFGACLMKTPGLVADCVAAMQAAVDIPVTVKCRLGVDDQDPEESLFSFVDAVAGAGCRVFIVHARKAWLQGLSPKENREIPPLDYELVRRLKRARPDLAIVLNGGIDSLEQAERLLPDFDGVMLGRAAYGDPYILAEADRRIFGVERNPPSREDVVQEMIGYMRRMAQAGVKPHHIARHMLGLFHGRPRARLWRRMLSAEGAHAGPDLLERALDAMRRQARHAA
ncbi:tRNA dihydrouridine(20/20a) synthase DusA [Amphiplicatus metriothermophilus]|uniref:tRNA-dihydrouridine(20/20a) synthase n=1 Tax=Amphiplicatus metriothermophilus TaxID=1519374 RepID=A0A239PY24_9PROT|nr:tRNA dihydrouridine(20/20a) synthase DusA [Amphiplicatus metriothermophilus]MBB5519777.1 tRNA-dihydrouridine synthase A [Amphiplicatus metriothermophilus]SNT75209.1 tRNA-U16,U17-dihydrouridine synthase [Amphiplicatus metriothermophilus]